MLLIVAIALLYWLYDKRFGEQLIFSALTSAVGNAVLKSIFLRPRPYTTGKVTRVELDNPLVSTMTLKDNMSFPSGHAQASTNFFGSLAMHFKRAWVWAVCILAVLLIMASRLYLGVHYPTDVLAGFALGAVYALTVRLVYRRFYQRRYLIFGVYAALSVLCCFLLPTESVCKISGAMTGAVIALYLEDRFIAYPIVPGVKQKLLRAIIGLCCILLPYFLLSLLPSLLIFKWIKYCVVLFFAALAAPLLFRALRI